MSSLKEVCKSPCRLSLPSGVLQITNWGKGGGGGLSSGGQIPVNIPEAVF